MARRVLVKGARRELRVVDGKPVYVLVCPPKKERKGLGLTKPKYQKLCKGAVYLFQKGNEE